MSKFSELWVNVLSRHRSAQCNKEREHSERYTQTIYYVPGKELYYYVVRNLFMIGFVVSCHGVSFYLQFRHTEGFESTIQMCTQISWDTFMRIFLYQSFTPSLPKIDISYLTVVFYSM